jgi:hypothetical protein
VKYTSLKDELEWLQEEAVLADLKINLLLRICWWGMVVV